MSGPQPQHEPSILGREVDPEAKAPPPHPPLRATFSRGEKVIGRIRRLLVRAGRNALAGLTVLPTSEQTG